MTIKRIITIVIATGCIVIALMIWMFKWQADKMKKIQEEQLQQFKEIDKRLKATNDSLQVELKQLMDTVK